MPNIDDYRAIRGHQKAAIMMLSLSEDQAMKLFSLMDEEEIKELSQAMAQLGTVNSAVVERLFGEFAEQIAATGSLIGSFESTERLLMKTMPKDRVEALPYCPLDIVSRFQICSSIGL